MNKNFIKASNKACSFGEHVPAPYLRRSFTLDFVPDKAEISICGLGFYVLYVNGTDITKGALAPYISNPDHYCYYDTYDLCSYLHEGENVIGIILGNGFFNSFGGAIWDFEKADWLAPPCTAVEFYAEKNDKSLSFNADENFKVHSSPIVFDELRMGEHYDANLEISGWNLPGFNDSDWQNALIAETPRGEMKLCTAEPIRITKTLSPQKIVKQDDGYLYDFGENTAGVCELCINASKGQKITMWHGEILKDGKFDFSNIVFERPGFEYYKSYNQKDVYTASGSGTETYTPKFVYHGFRYVFVQGITEHQATENLLAYKVMNSAIRDIGGFSCSDITANKLYEMVQRSDKANFYYFPTDCPHREKNGWTGDASVSADHMVLMYDVSASWHVWLDNIRKSQNIEGALPGIVPTDKWGFEWGNGPAYDSVLFNLPYMLYKYRGDTDIIKENAHAMMRYLEYIIKRRSADGTISVGLGDWVPTGKMKPDDYTVPLEVTDSIMVTDMAKKAAEMLCAVGFSHQADFAYTIYRDMRGAIRSSLIDFNTMTVKGCSQSGQALGIYYGIFDENEKPAAFERLLELIHANNDNFDCGFLGLHVLFHVLAEFGESDLAYRMITKKDYPSYGHLIENGETTITEQFMPDGVSCGSHNHHFLGDIGRWFMCCVAGLNVINHKTVEIRPSFIKTLDFASASYELPDGCVSVSWKRSENNILLDISCCSGVECKIILPEGYIMQNGIIKKSI